MSQFRRQEKAIFFIDGSNWYHSLLRIGFNSSKINYQALARKLSLLNHDIVEIRYYVGKVRGDSKRINEQSNFISMVEQQGVKVILGRVERKRVLPERNPIQKKFKDFLSSPRCSITDSVTLNVLRDLASQRTYSYMEKRVDVYIAIDMVTKAMKNEFDVAYLLSADGDFVPAVEVVREHGKKVFAASPGKGYELGNAVNDFIVLQPEWFSQDILL